MKAWNEVRLPVARYLSEVRSSALDREQQGRLALAWPTVYLAGLGKGCGEEQWRSALGYTPEQWTEVRQSFECVLRLENGWGLAFLADETARQEETSIKQRKRVAIRWNTTEYPASASTSEPTTNTQGGKFPRARKWGASGGFDSFWGEYPRKIDKEGCRKIWSSAVLDKELSPILEGLALWKSYWTDPRYIPHPSTFLRQRRWESEPPAQRGADKQPVDDGWEVTGPPPRRDSNGGGQCESQGQS